MGKRKRSRDLHKTSLTSDLDARIDQTAGGDEMFAFRLRQMLWHAYCEAGCPFGTSEEAMYLWWQSAQQTRSN